MSTFKKYSSVIAGLLCLVFVLASCSDDPSSVSDNPPQLPPVSSMEMNFDNFEDQQSERQTQTVQNFSRAALTAVVMKAVVSVNLAIPKALLTAAANTDAELNANDNWEWSYSKTAGGNSYAVRLVASREDDDTVNWNFYLTNSQLELEDRLFFSGTTNRDGSQGTWSYYDLSTDSQEEVSRINWTVNREEDVELRLEVISDRNDKQGDYLEYTFDGTLKTAIYYDNSEDEATEIQINIDTKVGYIMAPGYNDGMQACWNENFQDIGCADL